jgi:hypothetical protein
MPASLRRMGGGLPPRAPPRRPTSDPDARGTPSGHTRQPATRASVPPVTSSRRAGERLDAPASADQDAAGPVRGAGGALRRLRARTTDHRARSRARSSDALAGHGPGTVAAGARTWPSLPSGTGQALRPWRRRSRWVRTGSQRGSCWKAEQVVLRLRPGRVRREVRRPQGGPGTQVPTREPPCPRRRARLAAGVIW